MEANPTPWGDLRRVLTEFYTKHNPEKLDTIDKILTTYKGKEASLVRSLEKKYAVKIEFGRSAPASAVSVSGSASAQSSAVVESAAASKSSGKGGAPAATAAASAAVAATEKAPQPTTPASTSVIAPGPAPGAPDPATLTKQLADLKKQKVELAAELRKTQAAYDQERTEKKSVEARLREHTRHVKELQEKWNSAAAQAAASEARVTEQTAVAKNLQAKLAQLEDQLEPARVQASKVAGLAANVTRLERELKAARVESSNRHQQLTRALTVQHEQRMQLEVLLGSVDKGSNPYAPTHPGPATAAPYLSETKDAGRCSVGVSFARITASAVADADADAGANLALALEAARAEVAVMVRARAEDERRIAAYRVLIKDLRGKVGEAVEKAGLESSRAETMQREFEHKGSELQGIRDQYLAIRTELATEREQHASVRRDLEHARSIIQTAAGARRELEGLCRRQREAAERAARERVAQAEDSAALQTEEVLSQEFELLLLQRKAQDQETEVMQLEIDRLSKLVFELRAERDINSAEALHLRSELKRTALDRVAQRRGGLIT